MLPNYDSRFTMVFPASGQANHKRAYKQWSNYKGFNEEVGFTSPLKSAPMGLAAFEQHIQEDYLQSGMSKAELTRAFNALFRTYNRRFEENFEIASEGEMLVKDRQSGRMQRAPLNSDETIPFPNIAEDRTNTRGVIRSTPERSEMSWKSDSDGHTTRQSNRFS